MRSTVLSRISSSSSPFSTARIIFLVLYPSDPGISRSRPAFSPFTRSFTAPQSLTTYPSNPHSSRRISVRSFLFSEENTPLRKEQKIVYIGEFAKKPRYQGGGSSHINTDSVVSALETAVRKGRAVEYVKGFSSERDEMTEEELKQACEAAAGADAVVIFAGLPDSFESEGYDRTSMELPKCQNRLIEVVAEIQKNVVVVLHNGSPVETPWAESVNAILEMYLGGEGIGEASDRLLFGEANPGGRLTEYTSRESLSRSKQNLSHKAPL